MEQLKPGVFPSEFKLGVNFGSPYQIEGLHPPTDYTTVVNRPPEHGWWNDPTLQETDFGLAKDLGVRTARIGIEWARLYPEAGKVDRKAVTRYAEMVGELDTVGIDPIITLHHFTLPEYIASAGGWANPRIASWFKEYAQFVAQEIAHEAPSIVTINEPSVFLLNGYGKGYWPPHKRLSPQFFLAYANVVRAQTAAYRAIKDVNPLARVGVSEVLRSFAPANAVERSEATVRGFLFNELLYELTLKDFLGVNYFNVYTLKLSKLQKKPSAQIARPQDDRGSLINPQHFLTALENLYRAIKKPIIVTENGVADAQDRVRGFYLVFHLLAVAEAIKRGIPIEGYNYWSLTDTYEWMEKLGTSRFGLVSVDFETMQRIPRKSYYLYQRICREKIVDVDSLTSEFLTEQEREYLNYCASLLSQGGKA
ncbi:glycoside hydrolase family 1 protein [Candidatus Gottesmanbacteria bacterium]|nr:glycoside hydrolase family 1 protein [Candidatus Gottesmanbacteria bacterium]